ncbi:52 kDa repressor of the inhibitor of the protein kinase-like [Metopolophium dirhodum]|uniref:52 kDa repressor of the inhibitor of the protein kinase-like n=1 Tax=Metopolophium dirhodum TaxID=44670 RepID=UPI0029902AD9|nr:52 kDa repressor of the inhibitor of the protein kinase-like [Metopolophium dirhodum]
MQRLCITQRNCQNVPFQNTQEFYRRTVFIPHLNDIFLSLNERFLSHHEIINFLQFVLPNMIVDKPYSNLKTAVTFYQNDLKGYDDIIEAEYQLWQSKWNLVESRPSTAIEALQQCEQLMYPNMYERLKILSIISVSTATAKRSFSTLRILKNYLRNTTSESIIGLALLSIHRDVDITDDMVLDKFSISGKAGRLKLTI